MSMYTQYATDPNLERHGVTFDFGTFRVTLARAGGFNHAFQRVLAQKTKPYRRAISSGSLTVEKEQEIAREVYAASVITNWETNVDGEWKVGIEARDGSIMPYNRENVLKVLTDLPELMTEFQNMSNDMAHYRQQELEDGAGNS